MLVALETKKVMRVLLGLGPSGLLLQPHPAPIAAPIKATIRNVCMGVLQRQRSDGHVLSRGFAESAVICSSAQW
jgi:hypothetical protein